MCILCTRGVDGMVFFLPLKSWNRWHPSATPLLLITVLKSKQLSRCSHFQTEGVEGESRAGERVRNKMENFHQMHIKTKKKKKKGVQDLLDCASCQLTRQHLHPVWEWNFLAYVHVTIRTTFKQCNKLSQSLVGIDYKTCYKHKRICR